MNSTITRSLIQSGLAVALCSSMALAAPLIIATSEQASCSGGSSTVSITLDSTTYSFYGASSQLWFHFKPALGNEIVRPEPTGNPAIFTGLPNGIYSLTITTAQGSGGSGSTTYPITVSCTASVQYKCMEFVTWRTSNNASMSPVLASGLNPLEPPMTGTYSSYVANPASAGGVAVGGATIEAAATDCHGKTATTFNANAAWGESFCTSVSCPICVSQNGQADSYGRVFQGAYREVWAIDRFLEIPGTPQHYNKVAGYKVQCNAIVVTPENTLQGNIAPF